MDWKLAPHKALTGCKGPLVLAVLDGIGVGDGGDSDAVTLAATPTLDQLWTPATSCTLLAHGKAVGLPADDDMGNSEVGHNALGCGQIHDQGALLVNNALADDSMFEGSAWKEIVEQCVSNASALHFVGLLSDGNVHSHIDQLAGMIRAAAGAGVKQTFIHVLTDGRDVHPTSALTYIDQLEETLAEINASASRGAAIASGGGRMFITMDRYGADWAMVERGWATHVLGKGRQFSSARKAVETLRDEQPGIDDQNLPAFVIAKNGAPIGRMQDGDAVVCFNFRGDRVIELSQAFEQDDFPHFDRGPRPDVLYVGMMEYDGDLHIPQRYLVTPPNIERTMGELLVRNNVSQLAISETQKYGHVTYFWNGNRSGKFDDDAETYIEIASDRDPFEERPWMKAAEITDRLLLELQSGNHRFARVNYANGDMVGHTGSLEATIIAVQAVDLQLGRLRRALAKMDGILVVTADHGNADEMYQRGKDGSVQLDNMGAPVMKTSHTLNPVPFLIDDPNRGDRYSIDAQRAVGAGLASVSATCLELLGWQGPDYIASSLIRVT